MTARAALERNGRGVATLLLAAALGSDAAPAPFRPGVSTAAGGRVQIEFPEYAAIRNAARAVANAATASDFTPPE